MQLTPKQTQITDTIIKGNPDGTWVDMDQLLENLPYRTSKSSMQFSIRYLIEKGVLEKRDCELRRGQARRVYAPTALAYELRTL